jgi:hypothetical protein
LLTASQIASGSQGGSGATIGMATTPDGVSALRFSSSATAGLNRFIDALNLNLPTANVGYIGVTLYVTDVVESVNLGLTAYVGQDATFTNNRSNFIVADKMVPGWNHLVVPLAAVNAITGQPGLAVVNGAFTPTDNIRSMRFRIDSSSLAARDFYVSEVWCAPSGRGRVAVTFDDGWIESYSQGHAYAASKGLPLTHYLIPELLGSANYITLAQALEMQAAGDQLGLHGNLRWGDDPSRIATDAAGLRALGLPTDHAAYPEGAYGKATGNTPTVLAALAAQNVRTARTVVQGLWYPMAGRQQNPLLLFGVPLNNTMTLAQAKLWVDRAAATGGTLIFYGHKIGATADSLTWVTADWQALVDYIAAAPVDTRRTDQLGIA